MGSFYVLRCSIVAPIEVGEGVALLASSGLLKEHQTRDRKAVGKACLAALEQWSMGQDARSTGFGRATLPRLPIPDISSQTSPTEHILATICLTVAAYFREKLKR